MRKLLLILLVMQISLLIGNQFEIVSELEELPMHMGLALLEDNLKLDNRGDVGALLIINCGIEDILFQNMGSKISQSDKQGAYWVVLKNRAQHFIISKQGFPNHMYNFPSSVKGKSVYTMTIGSKNSVASEETVVITTNQDQTTLYIDDKLSHQIKEKLSPIKAPLGKHEFKLTKEGFWDKAIEHEVVVGGNVIELNLEKKFPVKVTIESNPRNAEVLIDNKLVGTTPLTTTLMPDEHTILIQKELYFPQNSTFSLDSDKDVKLPPYNLIPKFSAVTINCPSTKSVSLTLNGKDVGTLPYHNKQLLAGTYQLIISKDLWIPIEEELIIPFNETITKDFALVPNYGTFKITAPEADIYLNDKKVGSGYLNIDKLPGDYQITARREKHQDVTTDIVLQVGQEENITLKPEPRLGSISILTVDKYDNNKAIDNANIYLDNKLEKSKSPTTLSVLYGDYDLKISHPKFLDNQQKLKVTENQHREITISLETYAGTRKYHYDKHKKRAWISTGVASLIFAGAVTSNVVSNAYYDEYKNSKDYAETLDYKDKTSQWRDIRDYSYYAASGVAVYSLYSWIRTAIYNN